MILNRLLVQLYGQVVCRRPESKTSYRKDKLVDVPVVDSAVNRGLVNVSHERDDEVDVSLCGVVISWTGVVRLAVRWPDIKA